MPDVSQALTPEEATGFLRMFRRARERAVADAEDFHELIFATERFGAYLHGKTARGLGDYAQDIIAFAVSANRAGNAAPAGLSLGELMKLVQVARNDYMHQGARARHLVRDAVGLALILEDALMDKLGKVRHFMAPDVTSVQGWEPLSRVRQLMLQNGFSYIPYREVGRPGDRGSWKLISESAMARGIHRGSKKDKQSFLDKQVQIAVRDGSIEAEKANTVNAEAPVLSLVDAHRLTGLALVVDGEEENIVGVITPFDLI